MLPVSRRWVPPPPRSQYRYSNSDNIAAGLMIESATGKPYEKSLQKLVLDPLKLTSTSLPMGTVISEPTFRGYDLDEPNALIDRTTILAAG